MIGIIILSDIVEFTYVITTYPSYDCRSASAASDFSVEINTIKKKVEKWITPSVYKNTLSSKKNYS